MAISPLDLQTLFTQMDKVGKQEAAQRDGAALFQSIQQAKVQQQTDERLRAVNEAQNMGEGTEAVKDKTGGQAEQKDQHNRTAEGAEEKAEKDNIVFQDPNLGKNLDFSM